MHGRPVHLRIKRERGKVRVITYARGARGARRTVGSILIEPGSLKRALSDPDTLTRLGLPPAKPPQI